MCLILSFCSKCSFSSFVVEEKTYSLGNREMSRYVVLFCLTISSTLVHISFHFKFFLTFFFFPFLCRKSPLYIHELGLQIKVILFFANAAALRFFPFTFFFFFKLKLSPKSSYVSSGRRYIFNKTLMIILHKDYDIEFQRTVSIYVLRMLIFAFIKDFLFFISKFCTLYFYLLTL